MERHEQHNAPEDGLSPDVSGPLRAWADDVRSRHTEPIQAGVARAHIAIAADAARLSEQRNRAAYVGIGASNRRRRFMFGGFFSTLVGKLVIGVASVATATGGASAAGINVQELLGGGIPFSPEQRIEIIRSAVETEDLPAIEDLAGSLELNPTDGFALLDASDASEPSVDPDDTTGTTGTTVPDDGEEPDDTTGTTVTGDDNNDETDDEQDDETDDEQDDEADALRADHAAAVAAEEDHLADQLSHLVADRVDAETDAAERIERIEDDAAQDLTDLEAERASDIAAVEADLIAALAQIGADERAASADFDAAIVALDAGLAAALAALGT